MSPIVYIVTNSGVVAVRNGAAVVQSGPEAVSALKQVGAAMADDVSIWAGHAEDAEPRKTYIRAAYSVTHKPHHLI